MIRLLKGFILIIPRALTFDRFVAGQIPTGWSAERLGLQKDLADDCGSGHVVGARVEYLSPGMDIADALLQKFGVNSAQDIVLNWNAAFMDLRSLDAFATSYQCLHWSTLVSNNTSQNLVSSTKWIRVKL